MLTVDSSKTRRKWVVVCSALLVVLSLYPVRYATAFFAPSSDGAAIADYLNPQSPGQSKLSFWTSSDTYAILSVDFRTYKDGTEDAAGYLESPGETTYQHWDWAYFPFNGGCSSNIHVESVHLAYDPVTKTTSSPAYRSDTYYC